MNQRFIFVITSGWVLTGYLEGGPNSDQVAINDASCIRRWGTTNGLGQLATQGPTDSTVLDFCGPVEVSKSHVLFKIRCTGWP